jgi:hypothetical protein
LARRNSGETHRIPSWPTNAVSTPELPKLKWRTLSESSRRFSFCRRVSQFGHALARNEWATPIDERADAKNDSEKRGDIFQILNSSRRNHEAIDEDSVNVYVLELK